MNTYETHELLDRTYIVMEMFEMMIINHPKYKELPEGNKKVFEYIQGLLGDSYQDLAKLDMGEG